MAGQKAMELDTSVRVDPPLGSQGFGLSVEGDGSLAGVSAAPPMKVGVTQRDGLGVGERWCMAQRA